MKKLFLNDHFICKQKTLTKVRAVWLFYTDLWHQRGCCSPSLNPRDTCAGNSQQIRVSNCGPRGLQQTAASEINPAHLTPKLCHVHSHFDHFCSTSAAYTDQVYMLTSRYTLHMSCWLDTWLDTSQCIHIVLIDNKWRLMQLMCISSPN